MLFWMVPSCSVVLILVVVVSVIFSVCSFSFLIRTVVVLAFENALDVSSLAMVELVVLTMVVELLLVISVILAVKKKLELEDVLFALMEADVEMQMMVTIRERAAIPTPIFSFVELALTITEFEF